MYSCCTIVLRSMVHKLNYEFSIFSVRIGKVSIFIQFAEEKNIGTVTISHPPNNSSSKYLRTCLQSPSLSLRLLYQTPGACASMTKASVPLPSQPHSSIITVLLSHKLTAQKLAGVPTLPLHPNLVNGILRTLRTARALHKHSPIEPHIGRYPADPDLFPAVTGLRLSGFRYQDWLGGEGDLYLKSRI